MSKADRPTGHTVYVCQQCGRESLQWLGKCPGCQQWNTLVELTLLLPLAKPELRVWLRHSRSADSLEFDRTHWLSPDLPATTGEELRASLRELGDRLATQIIPWFELRR